MKFGQLYKAQMIAEWKFFYVHYEELKRIIEDGDDKRFHELLEHELLKVNSFFNLITKYDPKNPNLSKYIVNNYMALFKSIKKYDKVLCKTYKLNFFQLVKSQAFYKHYCNLERRCDQIKLVIFDKDGTLIQMLQMFGPWLKQLIANMKDIIPDITDEYKHENATIWDKLGYDIDTNEFSFNSIVARGTNDDIRNCICEFILEHVQSTKPKHTEDVRKQVKSRWVDIKVNPKDLKPCGDIHKIFRFLKDLGIKIAICTSDDREPTEDTIEIFKIGKYLDAVSCGSDIVSNKPSPEPIWDICNKLDIRPSETVMVGDTIADLHAGINAKCGKVISVLTGGYKDPDLNQADHILPSIDDIYPIIKANHCAHNRTKDNDE